MKPAMQQSLKSAVLAASLFLAGCQTLPGSISDLRPVARDNPQSTGTPLSEILARANDISAEQPPADPIAEKPASAQSESAPLLSIGIDPAPDTKQEPAATVAEPTDLPPTTPETSPEVVDLNAPQTVELTAVESLPGKPSVSDQLDWLPSLDDTLAAMTGRVANTNQLDEKIDALMSLAYVVDAQLYIAFRDLLDRLEPSEAELLMAEQREWLAERRENLTRAYLEFKADKPGRYNAAQAFLRNSHQRMREIQTRLAEFKPS